MSVNYFEVLLARMERMQSVMKALMPSHGYARVVTVSPLVVETELQPTELPANTVAPRLEVNDRVWFIRYLGRVMVVGKAGGFDIPAPASQPEVDAGLISDKYVSPQTLRGSNWVLATGFLNGASAQSFGHAPAYRKLPGGKVEWRGVVAVATGGATTNFLTIPAAVRPTIPSYMGGATNGGASDGWARLDVADPAAPTALRVVPGGKPVTWVSLDAISYDLS